MLVVAGMAAAGAVVPPSWEKALTHWAYQPLRGPQPPEVKTPQLVQTPVDAFLLQRLEREGLTFAPPADRRSLLRRLHYTLVGLPPTFEEIAAFEADRSPEAVSRVVERLLASPQYGERWGRHWLDVARYADTKDLVLLYGRDAVRPYAYTYRDYVIRAFNEDLSFEQFVADQLAADLEAPAVPAWRLAGLGFLTLGRLFDNNPHDQIDDQIDTVSRGMLGLTVACARCHDHKYDAITAADYYGLYGVFASTERPYVQPLLEDPAAVAGGPAFEERLAQARKELDDHIDAEYRRLTEILRARIGEYLLRAATTKPDITETTQFALSLTPEDFRPTLMQRTRRFLQRRAVPEDPVFGPWASLMALAEEGWADQARARLASLEAPIAGGPGVASGARARVNPLVLAGLRAVPLPDRAAVVQVYAGLLTNAYQASLRASTSNVPVSDPERELASIVAGDDGPVWFPRRDTSDHMSRPEKDRYNGLVLALDKIAAHATNAPPARAMVVADLPEPYAPRVFLRGNPARLGDAVPRGFLRILNGGRPQPFAGPGSGRLELARRIAAPSNPIAARVMVNRVWMHHFGEPLVSSPSDFGQRSDPPTHPELLDWLASEFLRTGGSWKHLHRVILLSAAFQQGSRLAPGVVVRAEADARWLYRYPRRRLDLESMRDTLLFVSGRLDGTQGGRPVDVAGDPMNRRRTVYGLVDRQNLPSLFRSFDFATPDQCVERRPRTTVPQQALYSLNSPFVMEQARALTALPELVGAVSERARVDALFRRVLGRQVQSAEWPGLSRFLEEALVEGPEALGKWEQLAQVMLASNEAVFLD
ncbi:MAG: DUF1553 domain-containing protein [Verrucomicrobiales bacterium]|nr:DUF1553 domain-containing protein [Verrucomicrobiales bacterium]